MPCWFTRMNPLIKRQDKNACIRWWDLKLWQILERMVKSQKYDKDTGKYYVITCEDFFLLFCLNTFQENSNIQRMVSFSPFLSFCLSFFPSFLLLFFLSFWINLKTKDRSIHWKTFSNGFTILMIVSTVIFIT